MDLTSTLDLGGGVALPLVGLGVFRAGSGQPTRDAVRHALARGYRHIDTARIYGNEEDVGAALKDGDVPREEVFVTTKLWNSDQGYDEALRAFDASCEALGLDVVDLYLMHWPVPGTRLDSWRAMERIHEEGRARAIGVSNFMPHHLEELFAHANTKPAVNQIELHPFGQQRAAVRWCEEHQIVLEAYSPLTRAERLHDPTVDSVASAVDRTPAQVLLRWALQKGWVILPKSVNPQRIDENASLFDFALTDAQMATLDGLEEGLHIAWDPTEAP